MSVYFHLPLDVEWNAELVLDELTRQNVKAVIVGHEIHVTFSSESCQWWRKRHKSGLDRRIAGGVPRRPNLAIRHHPERFLRNVELDTDPLHAPPSESHVKLAQALILDVGGILLDSLDREFDLAYSHCKRADHLARIRDRMEAVIAEKEKHVENFDFQLAASARDKEMEVRDELETFLLHAAD